MPDITTAIDGLTYRLRRYRLHRWLGGRLEMPIEIKGLKAKAMVARGHIDRINKAYDKFNEAAPAHAADVEGLAEQISQHHDDLSFAANVLGNSTEPSEPLAGGRAPQGHVSRRVR
jgi:hypothetical protein